MALYKYVGFSILDRKTLSKLFTKKVMLFKEELYYTVIIQLLTM